MSEPVAEVTQGQPPAQGNPAPPPLDVKLPVEAPKVEAPVDAGDTVDEFTYDPTGDAGLDYALNFVGKLGFGDQHPAIVSAKAGDFTLLKVELATKGVAGGEQVVKLAEEAHARFAKADAAKSEALSGFAAQAAGSAENWELVRTWAAANATPEEKAQVNSALSQGGLVAQGVIGQLVSLYQGKHTLPQNPQAAAKEGAGSSAGSVAEPMTAKAYASAVAALSQKLGARTADSQEYAALQNQRLAAKRLGY